MSLLARKSLLLLVSAQAVAFGAVAEPVDDARADIRSTYNFDPGSMSFSEQARRTPSLSALWDRYAKSPGVYVEALRQELQVQGQPELVYCDGGMLLLAKSSSADDQTLGLASIARCSLVEIEHTPYFYTLHALAVRGIDTFDLQARMLSKPKYSVFIVQHALSLGQDYAFLYPFQVQDENAYVPRLIARLPSESDPTAQKSLVRALWYAATPESEAAIRSFATSASASSVAKADALALLKGLDEVRRWPSDHSTLERIRSAVNVPDAVSLSELRAMRRKRMHSISDEALHDLEAYTALIYRISRGT